MTKVNPKLAAEIRNVTGRKVKHLRRQGWLPATVYGKGLMSKSVQIKDKEFEKIFAETGEAGLVDLVIGDETWPILFRNPQYHPVEGKLLHIDCYKVNLKEKIKATVPIELVGESPAVKAGNVLIEIADEIEVEALPTDLPEKIVVDISDLENLEQMITVADLAVDRSKVEVKTAADQVIVKLEEPKEEVVEEPVVPPEEVPATEQKSVEGETPTEEKKPEETPKES